MLVVDDEEPLLEIFVEFFEGSEYDLTIAKTGEEAIELITQRPFDLIVTDLNLPGADGLAVLSHAKSTHPNQEVIVLTGNASTLTSIAALRQGAYDYVLKPFDLYEMEQTVSKALERRRLILENQAFVDRVTRHRDELRKRVEEATWKVQTLYDVGKEITSNLKLDRTLKLILQKSVDLTHAGQGILFLLDESTGLLDCGVVQGMSPKSPEQERLVEDLSEINEKVLDQKEPLDKTIVHNGQTQQAWVVPLLHDSGVTGTIAVLSASDREFTSDDRDLLSGLASHASIAIHNAKVFEKMQALDRMKSEFVAVVSHEVRTPLTAIKGTLEILNDDEYFEMAESQRELLEICSTNVERLEALINDILDFSKLESSTLSTNFTKVRVGPLLQSVVVNLGNLAERKSIPIEVELDEDLPSVMADELRISQVVGNLLSNAIKFSPESGRIRVSARRDGEGIRFEIQDSGIGIAADNLPKLFTRFRQLDSSTTRSAGGTGLGLTISKGIVEEHRGRIWVESEFGQGSTFLVWIPLKQDHSGRTDGREPDRNSDLKTA